MYTKSWCDETQSYQMGQQIRQPLNLPDILVLNCNLESNRNEDLWRIQTELAQKEKIKIRENFLQ
jgi:PAB-dependent poly(A)-specific ribonuclease subunit 2